MSVGERAAKCCERCGEPTYSTCEWRGRTFCFECFDLVQLEAYKNATYIKRVLQAAGRWP